MIYLRKPSQFSPLFEVAGCFVVRAEWLLLLHRQDDRQQGNTWGVPAGKLLEGEKPLDAMRRELREETGIDVRVSAFRSVVTVFVRYSEYDFVFHAFSLNVEADIAVTVRPEEHKNHAWVSRHDTRRFRLIPDLARCIRLWMRTVAENKKRRRRLNRRAQPGNTSARL